ncbi:MAG: hypothetical protein KAS94_11660 [Desulfobulbaceae bacterium]|nr:hypothetical protein [Desulfobulbaceae bacterium]
MNLRSQIFLVAFALGIIPILTLVGVNLRGHIKRHEEVGLRQAEVRQELELANLNGGISHYRQTLNAVATLPEVREIINSASAIAPSPQLVELLNSWFSSQDAILAISLYNHNDQKKLELLRNDRLFQPYNSKNKKSSRNIVTDSKELFLSTTIGTGESLITASFRIDTGIFLAKYLDSLWINSAGTYIHQPYAIKLTITPDTNAFEDFPRLQPLLSKRKAALWESPTGYTVTWMPVILNGLRPTLWIGTEVDRTAALKWKRSLIRNIITITLIMAAFIFVIANGIARKIDSIKEQILTGLDRVMNNN